MRPPGNFPISRSEISGMIIASALICRATTIGITRAVQHHRAAAQPPIAARYTSRSRCMNKHVSSRLEMGARALEFSRAHPVKSDGYATALKQLEDLIVRGRQLAKEQESGITEVRAATDRR